MEPPTAATAVAPVEPVFTSPKQLQETNAQLAGKEEPIALLPFVQLRWAVRSKTTATGGVFRKHKSSKEIFAPADAAVLQRVLSVLQDDLVARLQAAGWESTTVDELGGDLPQVKAMKPDKTGALMFRHDDGVNEADFAVTVLPGAIAMDPKAIMNGMAIGKYLRGKAGVYVNVVYNFAPGTVAETSSRQLGTEAGSGLWFSARADLIGAKSGAWGSINVVPTGVVVADTIGQLAEIKGSKAGVAENVIRYMGGMGSNDRTGYDMTPDWPGAEAAMLRAGRAFNAEVVSRLAP